MEVTTDKAGPYLRVLDELVAAAAHMTEQYANNRVEADHGRLKAWLRPMPARLTTRQLAVLTLLAKELTSAQIAERLVLSRRTVDNHVTAILARLGVSGRREAVAVAVEAGWLGSELSEAPMGVSG